MDGKASAETGAGGAGGVYLHSARPELAKAHLRHHGGVVVDGEGPGWLRLEGRGPITVSVGPDGFRRFYGREGRYIGRETEALEFAPVFGKAHGGLARVYQGLVEAKAADERFLAALASLSWGEALYALIDLGRGLEAAWFEASRFKASDRAPIDVLARLGRTTEGGGETPAAAELRGILGRTEDFREISQQILWGSADAKDVRRAIAVCLRRLAEAIPRLPRLPTLFPLAGALLLKKAGFQTRAPGAPGSAVYPDGVRPEAGASSVERQGVRVEFGRGELRVSQPYSAAVERVARACLPGPAGRPPVRDLGKLAAELARRGPDQPSPGLLAALALDLSEVAEKIPAPLGGALRAWASAELQPHPAGSALGRLQPLAEHLSRPAPWAPRPGEGGLAALAEDSEEAAGDSE